VHPPEARPEPRRRLALEPRLDGAAKECRVGPAIECGRVFGEPGLIYQNIVVGPDDVFAAGLADGRVPGVGLAGLGFVDAAERQARFELGEDGIGRVRAAVVDHHQLPGQLSRYRQLRHALQRLAEQVAPVPGADGDGQSQRHE
jgi:hypothetical protein